MTDQDASPPPNLHPQRAARLSNSPYRDADARDTTFLSTAGPSAADVEPHGQTARPHLANRNYAENRLSGVHRAHKHRSSGGFLLADPVGRHNSTRRRDPDTYTPEMWQRRSFDQQTLIDSQHGQQPVSGVAPNGSQAPSGVPRPSALPEEESNSTTVTNRSSLTGDTIVGSSPGTSTTQLDVESAQIVSMALNLSESRRLASRRNVSQPTPPRLTPLPDNAHGGSLRYHLQQQRKISRTVSPKPDRSPRVGIGRVFTSLQPAFDPGTSYHYHFSTSTLARAQKAKEYLELMAQYRRVLELVLPLEPERTARPWTATPPVTPNGSGTVSRTTTNESEAKIGRPYNPLQYIRNRKVRARERRTIDGEEQGFTDVMKVSEWVDDVAKWVATGQARQPGNPSLPPFTSAQAAELQASPPPANARAAATTKPKRPRVDWVIDPADMLADVHWLELDDNKRLVEDRHWRRVFPQAPEPPRPISRDEAPRLTTPGSAKVSLEAHTPGEKATPDQPPKHEHEHVLMAARDRAQQKFRALKGSHHRHTSSFTNRDLLRLHRGSASESSDTDSDRRRRAKSGIPPTAVRSVLEKQMEEMIAREQREAELHPLYDHEAKRMKFAPMTPERDPSASGHHRADFRAELSETETKGLGLRPHQLIRSPPSHTGRASLEVPTSRRFSVDDDTSQPNSPNLRPTPDVGLVPALGMDFSPMSSRAGSPHRNPLTKVKSIFRERSKERNTDAHHLAEDGVTLAPQNPWAGAPETGSGVSSPQRRPSRSPIGERILGHRSHKSLSSAKLRGEDGGISFRSLLRGPRIDTVLRSGVSKVSDMIWRKDGDDSSSTSSDDSEAESRGRSRGPRHKRSRSAHDTNTLLDPSLLNNYESSSQSQLQHPSVRPISRRSSRFDLLKPPRIDVQNASPSTSPPPVQVRNQGPIETDAESQVGPDNTRAASIRLDTALTLPHRSTIPANRQWSIADRSSTASGSTVVSKREIARLRALLLSAGIHAMEMDRRAKARKLHPSPTITPTNTTTDPPSSLTWTEIANLAPDPATSHRLLTTPLSQTEAYPIAARTLAASIQSSTSHLHTLSSRFLSDTAPSLLHRVESLRNQVAHDLTDLAQSAIDAADEANHDLVVGQRLKVKNVLDAMDKMLRRRRRRFRWIRRVGWLVVEWVLVGCMWYVWFLVMIARVGLGVGKGAVRGVKWLLWL